MVFKKMSLQYQLRRIGLPASVDKVKNLYRITSDTTMIGRGQTVDVFLDSNIRKGLISRAHAQIIARETSEGLVYELFDSSLNGTYVNDFRINGSVILKAGDTIAFGHLQGALTIPGALAPQKETEFLFKFEKVENPDVKEEMVDLTDKELNNNSSVFMSPKSPIMENGEPNSAMGSCRSSNHDTQPPEKKVKYEDEKYLNNDEEDLNSVVTMVTSKINATNKDCYENNSSDDSSFVINCKGNELSPDARGKPVATSNMNNVQKMNNSVQLSLPNKPVPPRKKPPRKNSNVQRINNGPTESEEVDDEVHEVDDVVESESESEYMEESDSEKSEEIPDDSSDNEYIPKGKQQSTATGKKPKFKPITLNTAVAPPLKKTIAAAKKVTNKADNVAKKLNNSKVMNNKIDIAAAAGSQGAKKQKKAAATDLQKSKKQKRKDSFTHDKCDAQPCRIPSGNLRTVTWVQCDDCDDWYHVSCSNLSAEEAMKDDTIFQCGCA